MNRAEHQVVLLLGSNIQPEINLPKAVELLNQGFCIQQVSSVWETPAVGSDGPNFLNAAVLMTTHLNPGELKAQVLRPMEAELGRVRTADKNAPRTIDIDIVVWGEDPRDDELWVQPHAAAPVAELVPDIRKGPSGDTLGNAARMFRTNSRIRLHSEISQRIKSLFENSPDASHRTGERTVKWGE
jgi:2-amino-4-hydroxy-6-hydroxymethyldihydropteridine diphosphokinase